MIRTCRINKSKKEVFKLLQEFIDKPGEDTFMGHLKCVFTADNKVSVWGSSNAYSFAIWAVLHLRESFNPIYPVIRIKLSGEASTSIRFSHQMNAFGRILFLVISLVLFYGLTQEVIIQEDMKTHFHLYENTPLDRALLLFGFTMLFIIGPLQKPFAKRS